MAGAGSALKSKRELGKATRDAFGRALEALGADYPDLVVVDADVGNSTRTEWFGQKYPDRFFNIGISESNLVGIAGGLASAGKMSLISSFAAFITCNAYDQLRMSVAYPHLNVKVVGTHAGISIGEDGASQMGIEDVALACALPGFVVIVPADERVGEGGDQGDARPQGAGLFPRRPRRRPQGLHRRPGPVHDRQGEPAPPGKRRDPGRQRPDGRPGARRRRDPRRRGGAGPRPRHAHRQADRRATPSRPPRPRPVPWSSPRSTSPTAAWAAWWPWPSPS